MIGDWADGLVEAGEVKLVVSELPGNITQFRSVHPKGSRYGEEYQGRFGTSFLQFYYSPQHPLHNPYEVIILDQKI